MFPVLVCEMYGYDTCMNTFCLNQTLNPNLQHRLLQWPPGRPRCSQGYNGHLDYNTDYYNGHLDYNADYYNGHLDYNADYYNGHLDYNADYYGHLDYNADYYNDHLDYNADYYNGHLDYNTDYYNGHLEGHVAHRVTMATWITTQTTTMATWIATQTTTMATWITTVPPIRIKVKGKAKMTRAKCSGVTC